MLDIIEDEKPFAKVSVLTIINNRPNNTIIYDGENNKWTYELTSDQYNNTFLTRLLAKTIYNPQLDATVNWSRLGTYSLEELKDEIYACIDADDDILTQFEEGDHIKSVIDNCIDFQAIIRQLKKYVFEVDEEKLWKEQDERRR